MPTKLKKPITITITHVENAVCLNILNRLEWDENNLRHLRLYNANASGEVHSQIERALSAQGIDYRTWEPPQPFKIGAHETTFNPNGSIKVGCTDIDRATLLEVLKRSDQAMQKGEDWPRYIQAGAAVGRFDSEHSRGTWHYKGGETAKTDWHFADYPGTGNYKQVGSKEAEAFLGRKV